MKYIICLALTSLTFLGVGWSGISYYHKYLMWPAWLAFFNGGFRFTSFVVQNLGYLLSLVYQTCPFQIDWVPVWNLCACYLGSFPLIILSRFLKGSPKLSEELDGAFQMTWNGVSVLILPEICALVFWFIITYLLWCTCGRIVVLFLSLY